MLDFSYIMETDVKIYLTIKIVGNNSNMYFDYMNDIDYKLIFRKK